VREAAVAVLEEILGELVGDLAGIQAKITCIGREHPLGVTALGDVVEVPLLERDEDLLLELEDARGLGHGEA
jgi:hypothetical protein